MNGAYKRIWNSTFYPKGTLVIDGAPSTIGIVPFYVVNNSGSAVNMTTDGYTGSDMKVFYETTESGYWTMLRQQLLK